MTEKEVEDYIKVQKSLGVSDSDIHKALINAGYEEHEFTHTLHGRHKTDNALPKHLIVLNLTLVIFFTAALFYVNYSYNSRLNEISAENEARLMNFEMKLSSETGMVDQKMTETVATMKQELQTEIDANRRVIKGTQTELTQQIQKVNMEAVSRDKSLSDSVQDTKHTSISELTAMGETLETIKLSTTDFTQIIPQALDAVVTIGEKGQGYFTTAGAGVLVNNKGLIVTNWHVVDELSKITVGLYSGGEYTATIVGKNTELDVALIQLTTKRTDLPYLPFADSDQAYVGQKVIAVGNPAGLESTVTEGIISNTKRLVNDHKIQYLQTDVAVNRGNSGGPLITKEGKVIGIVTLKHADAASEGLNFALKSNDVNSAMMTILQG